ncbi:ABC transporter substrate-binding protein [Microbispora sp. H10670]|uniref:ABC transporter substrate-binding protein n=1 Tax=Microbispora sp. H10670 TaxID=2729108 RepID=UPI001602E235|nr:ABC transporter substrate-binding protein [Microbispora sp. H10670]
MTRRHLAAVLVLLLLAGCASPGERQAAAPAGSTITLGFSAWPGWFPWQVAGEQGLFRKNGVDVELKYFDSYTDSLNALATGTIDANSQTLNDTLASVAGGAKQSVVLVNDNSSGNDQIIAGPGISSLSGLKGRTVAAEQGTVDHYLLLLALRKAGLTEADVQFRPMPTDAAAAAFAAGQVDAVGVFAPFTTTALKRKGSRAIATSADFPGAIPDHLVVTRDLVSRDPKAVQGLVSAWFDALTWIGEHRPEALEIMAKRAGVSVSDYESYDKGTTIFTLERNRTAFSGELDGRAKEIAEFLVSAKLVDKAPPLEGLFAPQFVRAVQP